MVLDLLLIGYLVDIGFYNLMIFIRSLRGFRSKIVLLVDFGMVVSFFFDVLVLDGKFNIII